MPLKITILDGPNAGHTSEFGDDTEFVEIGRDPEHCGVLFPADFTAVGRRHLGIRRTLGTYELEVKASNPVLIDGREPFDGEPLGERQEIQLGRNGPRLRVEATVEGALPATDFLGSMNAPSALAHKQRRASRRLAIAFVALTGLAMAGGGGLYWQQVQSGQDLATMLTDVGSDESLDRVSPETLESVRRSTYLVLAADETGNEEALATAWVVDEGVLATNGHVAELFHELGRDQKLVVRATTAPYPTVPIDSVLIHPDYERFTEAWDRFEPLRAGSDVDAPGAGYDVALMFAAPGQALEPPLEIAEEATLAELQPGRTIAFVGFPMEMLAAGGVNPSAPVPQAQMGHVTAVTDYFLLPGDAAERNLVQHSMPATGGASGSPVVDASGRVVAILSGGNVIVQGSGQRGPSAAGVNFAQRASLVRELLEDRAAMLAETRDSLWEAGFATFDDPVESVVRRYYGGWLSSFEEGSEPIEVLRRSGTLEQVRGQTMFATTLTGVIAEPGRYLAIAVSRDRHDIDMALSSEGEVFARDAYPDWYPVLEYIHDGSAPVDVVVYSTTSEQPDYELMVWRMP